MPVDNVIPIDELGLVSKKHGADRYTMLWRGKKRSKEKLSELRAMIFKAKQQLEKLDQLGEFSRAAALTIILTQIEYMGLTPDVFTEFTDKEYTQTFITAVKQKRADAMSRLSPTENDWLKEEGAIELSYNFFWHQYADCRDHFYLYRYGWLSWLCEYVPAYLVMWIISVLIFFIITVARYPPPEVTFSTLLQLVKFLVSSLLEFSAWIPLLILIIMRTAGCFSFRNDHEVRLTCCFHLACKKPADLRLMYERCRKFLEAVLSRKMHIPELEQGSDWFDRGRPLLQAWNKLGF